MRKLIFFLCLLAHKSFAQLPSRVVILDSTRVRSCEIHIQYFNEGMMLYTTEISTIPVTRLSKLIFERGDTVSAYILSQDTITYQELLLNGSEFREFCDYVARAIDVFHLQGGLAFRYAEEKFKAVRRKKKSLINNFQTKKPPMKRWPFLFIHLQMRLEFLRNAYALLL